MEIETGAVRREELDTMLALMCMAFGLPFAPARDIFYADPYFDFRNKRVLRIGKRVVSCLTLVETACRLGAGTARLGGIAGVATLEAERRRGHAGRLLTDTIHVLRERGFALSGLFPFSYDYYRKFGWEPASYAYRCLVAPSRLPLYPERADVRLARPDDIPALERLYNADTQGKTLTCLRDSKRWRFILDHVKQRVVYGRNRSAEGYLLYEYGPGNRESLVPAVVSPPTLRILEMVAATPAARRGLLGYLADQPRAGQIEIACGLPELNASGLLEPLTSPHSPDAAAVIEVIPSIMVRILDLARVAQALRPNWTAWTGSLALEITDPILQPAGEGVLIEGDGDGEPTVSGCLSPAELAGYANRIQGDVSAWSPVVVGHLSADDACALGRLHPTSSHARDLAAALFPRRAPFLPAPDHF